MNLLLAKDILTEDEARFYISECVKIKYILFFKNILIQMNNK